MAEIFILFIILFYYFYFIIYFILFIFVLFYLFIYLFIFEQQKLLGPICVLILTVLSPSVVVHQKERICTVNFGL